MKEYPINIRYFFSSKGELPWEVYGGEKMDWKLSEKPMTIFGAPEVVQVWENTTANSDCEEYKD